MPAAKVYAFFQGYDYAFSMMTMFKSRKIKISPFIFMDSKSIFVTVTASRSLRELRLMNDIANSLTNHVGNDIIDNAMQTGRLDFVI